MELDLKDAKKFIKQYLKGCKSLDDLGWYNGAVDITNAIDFQELAEGFDLDNKGYDKIIDYAQNLAEEKANRILNKKGGGKMIKTLYYL